MQNGFNLDAVDMDLVRSSLTPAFEKIKQFIIREIRTNPEQYKGLNPNSDNVAIDALNAIVNNILTGKNIDNFFPIIARLTHEQSARSEIVSSITQANDYQRLVQLMRVRNRMESILTEMALKGKLTPEDSLAVLDYANTHIGDIEKKTANNSSSAKDVNALLAKIDYATNQASAKDSEKLKGTTPQNREIMRRVAHKLLKMSSNK